MKNLENSKVLTVISKTFPPLVIGSPILLDNLLSSYEGKLNAICGWSSDAKIDNDFLPPCEVSYLKMPFNFLQRVFDRYLFFFSPIIKFYIHRKLKKYKSDVVLAVMNPNPEFLVASYQICKKLNIPFMIHVHDLWEENAKTSRSKIFANKWEKIILEDCYKIFCTTERQIEWFSKKYGLRSVLLPHTIKDDDIKENSHIDHGSNEKNVVYTGNISHHMNLDIIQKFVKSIDYLPKTINIKFFTSWDIDECIKNKVFHERIEYSWLSSNQIKSEINKADALLLPLSFENCSNDEVKTVFSTKTLDYLISGVPIFVIAPKHSYHSISATKNGWGLVINDDNPKNIAGSLIDILYGDKNIKQIVKNAYKEANQRRSSIHATRLLAFVNKLS